MTSTDPGFRALAGLIGRMQKDLRSQGRASQAAFRSVEAADGPVRYYGPEGEVLGEIAAGPEGLVLRPPPGVVPATPTDPDAIGVQGGIVVKWDGTFLDANWSHTISHVEIHRSSVEDFTPNDQTLVGTYNSYWGGEYWTSATPLEGTQFFALVTVDRSGNRSLPSGTDSAAALPIQIDTDGEPPATSPAAVVRGGIGALYVSWDGVANADPVTYEVHLSTVDGFVTTAGTLVAETPATSAVLKTDGAGNALVNDVIYYVRIVAKDVDDAAPAGAQGGASMMRVTGDDIAVNYVYAGEVLADQITGGTMRSVVTIAGLFQTATSGGRVEIGPFGVRVYDANGVDVNVDLAGAVNRFRGSIDAVDMIVRDGLELFGQNNAFGPNSKVTLRTGQGGSNTPPSLGTTYKTRAIIPALIGGFDTAVGYHSDGVTESGVTQDFFDGGQRLTNPAGGWYRLNQIRVTCSDGTTLPRFSPHGSTRVMNGQGQERVAMIASINVEGRPPTNYYADIALVLMDDSVLASNGTVPPIIYQISPVYPFNWWRSVAIGRSLSGENHFVYGGIVKDGSGDIMNLEVVAMGADSTLELFHWVRGVNFGVYRVADDEKIIGVNYGWASDLKLYTPGVDGAPADQGAFVVHTTHQNLILNNTATARLSDYEWPVAPGTWKVYAHGNIAANELTEYVGITYSNNYDQPKQYAIRYSNWTWKGAAQEHFFSYAWRGHTSKSPEWLTSPSPQASVLPVKRGWLTVAMPPLPPPEAGQNAPRDINKDIFGWVLYGGKSSSNSNMWRQTALSPSNNPSTTNTAEISSPIASSGSNPLTATTGFPNLSPAKIVSSAASGGVPLLEIDGDGNIKAKTVSVAEVMTAARAAIEAQAEFKHVATPAAPSSGYSSLYAKSDTHFYSRGPSGTERRLMSTHKDVTNLSLSFASGFSGTALLTRSGDNVDLYLLITAASAGGANVPMVLIPAAHNMKSAGNRYFWGVDFNSGGAWAGYLTTADIRSVFNLGAGQQVIAHISYIAVP